MNGPEESKVNEPIKADVNSKASAKQHKPSTLFTEKTGEITPLLRDEERSIGEIMIS